MPNSVLDSNESLSKSLRHYVTETFLASRYIQKDAENPLFEVMSLLVPTGSLEETFLDTSA